MQLTAEWEAIIEQRVDAAVQKALSRRPKKLSLLVFSGEMDKLMVAFILATGAAALGMEVSMFFTFWGLAAIRQQSQFDGKRPMDQLLTAMLDAGPAGLPVSRMNMLGLGARFFEVVMRQKQVVSLPELIELARESDVRFTACQMSMQVMGIRREELLPNVELAGVAAYLADANSASMTFLV